MKLRSGKSYTAAASAQAPTGKVVKITKKVRVKKMGDQLKAQVALAVKTAMDRGVENKVIGWAPENLVVHNSAISNGDCVPLMGVIKQGTESYERIGDKVKPKRLRVSGIVSIQSTSFNTSQNLYARIVIASQKTIKSGVYIGTALQQTAYLLKPNFPTLPQTNFSGQADEFNWPINTDLFRVYMDKIVKLSPVYTLTANQSVCPTPTTAFRWSYTFKSLPTAFTFDDSNPDWVNNFAPFLAMGYGYADGTGPDVVATKLISNVYSTLSFEDA